MENKKKQDLQTRYATILREIQGWDVEAAHNRADKVLCELLTELGFNDVVIAFEEIPKWYA